MEVEDTKHEPSPAVQEAAMREEAREFEAEEDRKRRLWPRAAIVGLLAGLAAVALRAALNFGDTERTVLIRWAQHFGALGLVFPVLLGAVTGGIGLALVQKLAPEAAGSGIPHLRAVLLDLKPLFWRRVLPVKFLAGVISIGGGMAMGREGPTVQMGGAIGQMVSEYSKAGPRERATLLAAGAGAGLAAAFNAPLAGVVFVLEEIERNLSPAAFSAVFVACAMGDIMTRLLVGPFPAFRIPEIDSPSLSLLPYFAVLGAVCGSAGVVFNRSLLWSLAFFEDVKWPFPGAGGALVGALIGVVAFYAPETVGGGHHLAEATLRAEMALAAIPLLFFLRFALTMSSYGTGAAGGIFAPLLVLGAQVGLAAGLVSSKYLGAGSASPSAFAVIGMAAFFTATVRAPLTGIVLIAEMTGGYELMLPLLAASATAYGIAEWLREKPIYEALLERSLGMSQPHGAEPPVTRSSQA
jgi:CIC family chloride channel protein